jgi:general secretion pathway protein G
MSLGFVFKRTPIRSARGFTVIELVAVLALLSVLAMAALPLAELTWQRERERELKRALWEIRDAIDAHKRAADAGRIARVGEGYPASLEVLVEGVPSADGSTLRYFLRRLPRDPFAAENLKAAQTWGLRSYSSSADRPQSGQDVCDVYSLSTRSALNGQSLRDW